MAPGPLLNLLLFLTFIVPAWPQGPQAPEATGAVGGVALLNPKIGPQTPLKYSQIHWRWEERVRVASRNWGEQPTYPPSPFGGRLELLDNLTLRVGGLELRDSGRFRLLLEDEEGTESAHDVLLKVYEVVPKPRVTATPVGDPRRCEAALNCSVPLPEVTYQWVPPRGAPAGGGPVLRVTPEHDGDTFMCRASNPVSFSHANLTFRRPCTWTEEESSSATCATPSALPAFVLLLLLLALA